MQGQTYQPIQQATIAEPAAAHYIGISLKTLQRARKSGRGPSFMQLSTSRIAYRQSDLDEWLASRVTVPKAA